MSMRAPVKNHDSNRLRTFRMPSTKDCVKIRSLQFKQHIQVSRQCYCIENLLSITETSESADIAKSIRDPAKGIYACEALKFIW
eukprot:m.250130 g.250130  ORF g.250130 m.250130 type:complete len:84 (-) comp16141_c0_seq40:372-623(-)